MLPVSLSVSVQPPDVTKSQLIELQNIALLGTMMHVNFVMCRSKLVAIPTTVNCTAPLPRANTRRSLNVQVDPEVHEFMLDARRPLGHDTCLPEGHLAAIWQPLLHSRLLYIAVLGNPALAVNSLCALGNAAVRTHARNCAVSVSMEWSLWTHTHAPVACIAIRATYLTL